jgi:pimeloyl-ACP methyl ester carboxylesterase
MFRYILCFLGFILALPLLAFIVMVFKLPITTSGFGYLLGAILAVSGLILAPKTSRYYVPVLSGILLVIVIASIRLFLVENTDFQLKVITLPQARKTSWINTLIDEQDNLVFGEALFHRIGGDSDSEHENLASAFADVYSEMREEGNFSSPIVSTYLHLQTPSRFDAVVIGSEGKAQFGVVFLHGYMGNVTGQCWVVAQAVKELGGVTICPSTVWTGAWWQPDGQLILQNTFSYLWEHGIQRIYLGGFSNGGFSIGRLAADLKNEKGLSGLIFIDGFMNGETIRNLGLPVLIIEGTQDTRVPVTAARQFVEEVGDLGTYVELNSDHFLIMKQPTMVRNTIVKWLEQYEAAK